jgi:hypothetical protein
MDREDYAGLIYVVTSLLSMLVFSICLVIYLMYKQINVYLVGVGLLMLLTGFISKKYIEEPKGK